MELSLVWVGIAAFVFQVFRYVALALPAHWVVTHWRPAWVANRSIADTSTSLSQARRDAGLSFLSMTLFGGVAILIRALAQHGWVNLDPTPIPAWWAVAVIPVLLVGHDAWFYLTHRLLHTKLLFGLVHRAHHLSRDPSPLTAFAFHPLEAIVQATYVVLALLVLPVPRSSLMWFQTVAFLINVYGHLGVELLPARFRGSIFFRLLNTTTHHHQHHQSFNHNYGLYFQWWDRLFGTNHPHYAETFSTNASKSSSVTIQTEVPSP
jgi:Delta7-sterol 5-desaturase